MLTYKFNFKLIESFLIVRLSFIIIIKL